MTVDAAEHDARSGFLRSRVVQVHPTLRCNLRCSHCYSSSEPRARGELPPERLLEWLTALRTEGYDVVSFSGGEPLLYRPLPDVARAARALGYRVNLITNGTLVTPERIAPLRDTVSLIGVSLDGPADLHDRLRGAGMHARAIERLAVLRDAGVRFGIAHCVTSESLAYLPELAELCVREGAGLLQLHPLTLAGRAAEECGEQALTRSDLARLYLIARLLQVSAEPALQVQLDLAPIQHVLDRRDDYAVLRGATTAESLSTLVNPVVLDPSGALWPLAYGMDASQRIAGGFSASIASELERYRAAGTHSLRGLLESALSRLAEDPTGFVDWYGLLVAQSHSLRARTSGRLATL